MAFSLASFCSAPSGTVMEAVDPVLDDIFSTYGEDLTIGSFNKIIGLSAYGHSIGNAYVISPSLRRFARIYIAPMVSEAGGIDYQYQTFDDRHEVPVTLDQGEKLNAQMEVAELHADWYDLIGVWLADGPITPVKGEVHTVYMTDTDLVCTIGTWVSGEVAITPDLPAGKYQIVGARAWTAYNCLARFIFREETNRPGFLTCNDKFFHADPVFRHGRLGVWGTFDPNMPPKIEVCSSRAGTGIYARVDLIKIA